MLGSENTIEMSQVDTVPVLTSLEPSQASLAALEGHTAGNMPSNKLLLRLVVSAINDATHLVLGGFLSVSVWFCSLFLQSTKLSCVPCSRLVFTFKCKYTEFLSMKVFFKVIFLSYMSVFCVLWRRTSYSTFRVHLKERAP